jgi:serine/threonine protein phosphatase PrpC
MQHDEKGLLNLGCIVQAFHTDYSQFGITSHAWCRSALETAVHTSVQNVDAAVLKSSDQQQTGSGTTAVFALAFHQQILLAHLGDSRAVLCQQQSRPHPTSATHPAGQHVQQGSAIKQADNLDLRAVPLTIDHSPDRPDERARIAAAGGTISTATAGEQPTYPDCCAAPCSSAHAGMLITHSC